MIQIGNVLVSFDVFEKKFSCDIARCKGVCCVDGDSGAPLEKGEKKKIERNYPNVKPYMKPEGIVAVEQQGFAVIDRDGGFGYPLDCKPGVCLCH